MPRYELFTGRTGYRDVLEEPLCVRCEDGRVIELDVYTVPAGVEAVVVYDNVQRNVAAVFIVNTGDQDALFDIFEQLAADTHGLREAQFLADLRSAAFSLKASTATPAGRT